MHNSNTIGSASCSIATKPMHSDKSNVRFLNILWTLMSSNPLAW